MTALHILTSEYPPDLGGVSDYTRQVAEALARDGQEVHVWCPPTNEPRETSGVRVHAEAGRFRRSDLRRLTAALDSCPSPRRLLVQWVPHGFGYRSMNLPFCLWLAGRAAKEDSVELMVHEPFIELRWGPLRHIAIAIVHRVMTMVLMAAAEKVWVAIPAWESRLRPYAFGRSLPVNWLPIPACVGSPRGSQPSVRPSYAQGSKPLIGHFGSYGDEVSRLLVERLPAIMDGASQPSLLLIGARSEAFRSVLVARHPAWKARVHSTGYVLPAELTRHLEACDLFLQPYPDGITSRRTSAMACLSLGRPIVTTSGHLSESLWAESGAVALVNLSDAGGFSATANTLLTRAEERERLGQRGLRLYREQFGVERVVDALTSRERAHVSLPSCA